MRALKVVLSYVTDVAAAEDKSLTGIGRTFSKQNFLVLKAHSINLYLTQNGGHSLTTLFQTLF